MKFLCVTAARPNFPKVAPIIKALKNYKNVEVSLLHTGQHMGEELSGSFFRELGIPKPNYQLEVGLNAKSKSQKGIEFLKKLPKLFFIILKDRPDFVIVVGDVTSTLICTLVARFLFIKVVHVEAGLRSYNKKMPEETNRIYTDKLSRLLFVTEKSAMENLKREGVNKNKIFFVGNVMIDTLLLNKKKASKLKIKQKFGLKDKNYCVLTMHRKENIEDKNILSSLLDAVYETQKKIKVFYPMHPSTEAKLKEFNLEYRLKEMKNLVITKPLSYLEFLNVVLSCKFVLTDSGGIQEETTALGIPCITMRSETERPITVEEGTNMLAGLNKEKIVECVNLVLNGKGKKGKIPEYWDGKAAERIASILVNSKS